MEKGIVLQGYAAMHKDPADTSEMVSQVLFGEQFEILDTIGEWQLISLDFDGYQGWIAKRVIIPVHADRVTKKSAVKGYRVVSRLFIPVQDKQFNQQLYLPAGSILPGTSGKVFQLCNREFELASEDGFVSPGPGVDPEAVGTDLLSIPYLWGGRSGFGFDCSGLTQMLCRIMGRDIPRDCSRQAELGSTVHFKQEIRKGDLAFFYNLENVISHAGMVLEHGRILHASGNVRIDNLDQLGIFNTESGSYTHKLRVIKRMI